MEEKHELDWIRLSYGLSITKHENVVTTLMPNFTHSSVLKEEIISHT